MFICLYIYSQGFPGSSMVKNLPANAGDTGSIPGSGRSPGEGNDNPLQYYCLENPMDRGAWLAEHAPSGCWEFFNPQHFAVLKSEFTSSL